MEKALEKLAKQIMTFDEASLAALFEKYSEAVQRFEPTRKWEESVVIFGIIQTVRWKNQLFNHRWKSGATPQEGADGRDKSQVLPEKEPGNEKSESGEGDGGDKRGKVLRFRPREDDEPI